VTGMTGLTRTLLWVLPALICLPGAAWGSSVSYTVENVGGSTWQYTYTFSGFTFSEDDLMAIYFPLATTVSLEDPPPSVGPDWTLQDFQPDPSIPADGEFDAIANIDNPANVTFVEDFVYSGTGTPGAQNFTFYFEYFDNFVNGTTVPQSSAIPEPGSVPLLAIGLAGLALARRALLKKGKLS